jgi:hypothetical protein
MTLAPLLQRADLKWPAGAEGERLFEDWPTFELAADFTDDPVEPAAQDRNCR